MITRRHFRHFVFYPLSAVTGLVTLTWFVTPFVAKHVLTSYFEEQNQTLTIDTLSVDFFPPRVDVRDVIVTKAGNETFTLEQALFKVELWPLFTKTVRISEANIKGLTLDVTQQENDWIVAGINTAQYNTDATAEVEEETGNDASDSAPWTVQLPAFSFTNSQVNLSRQPDLTAAAQQDTLILSELRLTDIKGQALDWQGDVALSLMVNNTTFALNSTFGYSPEQSQANIRVKDTRLLLSDFAHFIPAPFNQSQGEVDLAVDVDVLLDQSGDVPTFEAKNLTVDTHIRNLDLTIASNEQVTTKATHLSLAVPSVIFASEHDLTTHGTLAIQSDLTALSLGEQKAHFETLSFDAPFRLKRSAGETSAEATLDLSSTQFAFTQADQNLEYGSLSLKAPVTVEQNDTVLSAIGDLALQIQQVAVRQADQQATFDDISIGAPFDVQQNQSEETLAASGQLDFSLKKTRLQQADQDVSFGSMTLNSPFNATQDDSRWTAQIDNTHFDIHDLALSMEGLSVKNAFTEIDLSALDMTMAESQDLTLAVTTQLNSQNLEVTQANNTARYTTFSLANTLSAQKAGETMFLDNTAFEIQIENLYADQNQQERASLAFVELTGDRLTVDIQGEQAPAIQGKKLNFASQGLDTFLTAEKRVASWASAGVSDVTFAQQDSHFDVTLGALAIRDLVVSESLVASESKESLPPLATVGNISVSGVTADQEGAEIKQVTIDSFDIQALINEQKQLENLVFVSSEAPVSEDISSEQTTSEEHVAKEQDTEETATTEQDSAISTPYYIILDAYDTTGASKVALQDRSIRPILQRSVEIDTLSVRNLNTKDKEQATVVAFQARNDKYATLNGDLTLWPLADRLTLDSEFAIREAELPPFSSYISSVLGYQIDSGQLDLDLKLKAEDGVLNGNSNIVLREFELGGRKESSSVIKAGAVPLNIAVGILKDSNNVIDLDIPFSGDIDNPEFGWRDFLLLPVRKALYSASSSYLMQTFIPYANVITIAQFAGDQLLKIRVEPLIFDPESVTLGEAQSPFIEQLSALMKDKKDSQLKACGITSYRDLGFETPPKEVDADTLERGKAMALLRANALKEYLVNHDIPSSRVFVCSPEVDLSKNSQPRIELNF
ncbi:DUF748 domain-containing protein [Marinomonas algarum]|uniref:DUF748 domain-containing protein n=1 Tax=Marinomonas algarum TaxID=2883105 RepID=A0A9X1IKN9_9GAMM|nr:DUF748 domain-containing protein [Marinomonas algarum]MCB5161274.1 DUF748 domain-containing protein [Marinomonas algarum]